MKKNTLLLAESIKELFESKNYAAIRAAIVIEPLRSARFDWR